MKKLLLSIIVIALSISLFGCNLKLGDLEYKIVDDEIYVMNYSDKTTVFELEIPDEIDGVTVTTINNFGVANSETLRRIIIGANVTHIGNWALTNNHSLIEFIVSEDNPAYCSVDGVLFSKDMTTLIQFPMAYGRLEDANHRETRAPSTTYTIPDTVTTIRNNAFYKCQYVEEIILPQGLLRIEEKAFHRATNLAITHTGGEKGKVILPPNLKYIGKDAFSHCYGIKSVVIP